MDLGLLEDAPVLSYLLRREGDEFILQSINAAARQQNPVLQSLIGKPMAALYSDQPAVIADATRCATENVVVERELAVRRYDRTEATQYVRLRFVPLPPSHLILFMHELQNSEIARKALSESEARYQSLVSSLPDAVLLRGADGRVLFCNELAVQLFGAPSQADLLGKVEVLAPGLEIRNEAGEPVRASQFPSRRVLATGEPECGQVYALVSTERRRFIRVAAQPVRSASGQVTGSVTTFTDVTERVQTQTALRESAARLDLALGAARMGVWEYEPATDQGWWSPNLNEIFDLSLEGSGFARFLERVQSDDRAALGREVTRIIAGEDGSTFEKEFRLIGRDGVTRWARAQGRLTWNGTRRHLAGTLMDITEQRLLEEQLHRASRLESIGRLAGGVAHDFNNLLAAMLGSLDLIDGQVSGEVSQDLATIRHSALRARELTRQLLAFARKQPVVQRVVDLSVLVRDVELLLRRLVGPSIAIAIQSSGRALVSADPSLLEQVLVNLVVNARDAMPNGGRLEIRVQSCPKEPNADGGRESMAVLSVADSGTGMDEETRGRVFEPFFTTKSHGTGLGLASSYGIIQQHRGDIRVESELGRGTRFVVSLPSLPDNEETRRKTMPPQAAPAAKGTVLVVDDEDAVRRTTARLVQSLGYEVLDAASVAQAVERSSGHSGEIDLLLCDIAMPGEDGRNLAAELLLRRKKLKVVFMSGYSSDMQEMRVDGALFLQKPFSRDELARKLAELQSS
jgi:two-component system, cell cycle sensor histidine kinase and response regulator CckA